MKRYIDKSTLSADIDKRKNLCEKIALDLRTKENKDYYQGKAEAYSEMSELIDTLEVKEVDNEQLNRLLNWWKEVTTEHSAYKAKEVDLDKELNKYFITNNLIAADIQFEPVTQMKKCAKYFFELGISVGNKTNKIE